VEIEVAAIHQIESPRGCQQSNHELLMLQQGQEPEVETVVVEGDAALLRHAA
jgi:hypothetical protein